MHRPVIVRTIVLAAALGAGLAGVLSHAQEEPSVGWALDVAGPGGLSQIDAGVVAKYAMEVRDGALRLTYDPQKHAGPVSFNLNFPEPFDLTDFPILEVKWERGPGAAVVAPELSATVRPEELPYAVALKIEGYAEPDQEGGRIGWFDYWGQYPGVYDPSDANQIMRLMPDAGFPDAPRRAS